jgi:hypothetical protein
MSEAPDTTALRVLVAALGSGRAEDLLAEAIAEQHAAARLPHLPHPARRSFHSHMARALEHLLDAHHALDREREDMPAPKGL